MRCRDSAQAEHRRAHRQVTLRTLAAMLFYGMFLPLAIILSMVPDSWFSAEGYEDLGEREFVASQVSSRVSRSNRTWRKVIYRAIDGSGLEFKMQYLDRVFAQRAVDNQEQLQRHVYAVMERPALLHIVFRKYETWFVPLDENFQDSLDTFHKEVLFVKVLSWTYTAAYAAAAFLRRRARKRQNVISASQDSRPQ